MSKYKVGDPDPTPNTDPWCRVDSADGKRGCSWRPGHSGDHVCGNGTKVVAVWPNEADAAQDDTPKFPAEALHRYYAESVGQSGNVTDWSIKVKPGSIRTASNEPVLVCGECRHPETQHEYYPHQDTDTDRIDEHWECREIGCGCYLEWGEKSWIDAPAADEDAEGEVQRPDAFEYAAEDGRTPYSDALDRYADHLEAKVDRAEGVNEANTFINKQLIARISALTTELAEERAKLEALKAEKADLANSLTWDDQQVEKIAALQAQLDAAPQQMVAEEIPTDGTWEYWWQSEEAVDTWVTLKADVTGTISWADPDRLFFARPKPVVEPDPSLANLLTNSLLVHVELKRGGPYKTITELAEAITAKILTPKVDI